LSPEDDIIRASEIGQYVFCARAWWYGRVKGYQPENVADLQRGATEHRRHGRTVEGYYRLRWVGLALVTLAGLLLVAWLILSLGA
jgi:hypothetical protein